MPSANLIGSPFIELPTVESTNNYAIGLVRAGMVHHGTAVFAHEQTKGKGQRSKEWVSLAGLNIAISIIITPDAPLRHFPFLLSKAAALAASDLLFSFLDQNVFIKWPNDLYLGDRKAGGILIENIWKGKDWTAAVIGIGLNINQTEFGPLHDRATSLAQLTGQTYVPLDLARRLCSDMQDRLTMMKTDATAISNEYKQRLYKLNQCVTLKQGARVFDAIVKDVLDDGQLEVEHGTREHFSVGEVEWIFR